MNDEVKQVGKLSPAKLLQDAQGQAKEQMLNEVKSKLKEKVETKNKAKKAYQNAKRELDDFLHDVECDLKDLEANV